MTTIDCARIPGFDHADMATNTETDRCAGMQAFKTFMLSASLGPVGAALARSAVATPINQPSLVAAASAVQHSQPVKGVFNQDNTAPPDQEGTDDASGQKTTIAILGVGAGLGLLATGGVAVVAYGMVATGAVLAIGGAAVLVYTAYKLNQGP